MLARRRDVLFELRHGRLGFLDSGHARLTGNQKLLCAMTLHDGHVVWDTNGLTQPEWRTAGGPYELYYCNYK